MNYLAWGDGSFKIPIAMNLLISIAVIVIGSSFASFAQKTPLALFEIGISANAYRGDLGKPYSKYDMSIHAGLRMNKYKRINFHARITYGHLTAQSTTFQSKDLTKTPASYVRTTLAALQAGLYANIFKTSRYNLFIAQEIGLLRFEPKDEQGRKLADLPNTRAQDESYNTIALIFPTVVGAVYYFSNGFGIGTQVGWYNTLTPYLDNINKLGGEKGNDNIYAWKFFFYVPLKIR
ncbi:MAG: hypothetical protein NZM38_06305 [Cytophagales bacterium]|nr:hypothetical protein [Cytophagales bacterium]MDW8384367.1 hypothetical protein [Flammeovirgaceae bacterium]